MESHGFLRGLPQSYIQAQPNRNTNKAIDKDLLNPNPKSSKFRTERGYAEKTNIILNYPKIVS